MTFSEMTSCVALGISAISLFTSLRTARRDTVRIRAWATFHPVHEYNPSASISVVVVNEGRRPAILRVFGGDFAAGGGGGTLLGDKGLRLSENERHEEHLGYEGLSQQGPENDDDFVRLWFEDSLGNRYAVKGSEEAIRSFRAS